MSLNINAAHSASYYLRNFYSSNRSAAKTESYRSNSSNHTLVLADSAALKKAVKALSNMDYDSTDESDDGDIRNSVSAFVSAYNNFIDSSGSSDYHYVKKQKTQIKNLVQEYAEDFEKVGITINTRGKLEIDDDELEKAKLRKIEKLFSSKSDFSNSLEKHATAIFKYETKQVPKQSASAKNTSSGTASSETASSETNTLDATSMAELTGSLVGSNVDIVL